MASDDDICTACGDRRGNHEGRIHTFGEVDGQLETEEQRKKREQMSGQSPVPQAMRIPMSALGAQADLTRLVELLIEKGLFNEGEALYVFGVGSKPAEQHPRYLDPATMFDRGRV